jgi:hypothetical protein
MEEFTIYLVIEECTIDREQTCGHLYNIKIGIHK